MHYYTLGKIPRKRHIQFRKENGDLYQEEVVSTEGFSNEYSIVYHKYPPTEIVQAGKPIDIAPEIVELEHLKHRCVNGFQVTPEDDYLKSRKPLMVNDDCKLIMAAPKKSMTDYFFKNADCDEVIFIHVGSGTFKSMYGELKFSYGDYIVVPRGTVYQLEFDDENNKMLIIESSSPIVTPRHYRNEFGQLLEHSPFCERDIVKPSNLKTYDEKGEFQFYIKKREKLYPYTYRYHPFDVVGWDGHVYPYIFSIHDFEPITGRIHQPPPVHLTFTAAGFVICSFVPRLYDYHPESIPAPYHHSNIDSDEVLYYVDGQFMSRKHVDKGMFTLHPGGIPHGPHPGTIENSIGKKGTEELAVMVDTFRPLSLTKEALAVEDPDYYKSWLED